MTEQDEERREREWHREACLRGTCDCAAPLIERDQGKDPAAVSLGRRGGLKGGPARAAALTPDQRHRAAQAAARARWGPPRHVCACPCVCFCEGVPPLPDKGCQTPCRDLRDSERRLTR